MNFVLKSDKNVTGSCLSSAVFGRSLFRQMPVKRRNHGRSKMNRGHTRTVNCMNCGRLVPKDKAIKRFATKNMVEASSAKDVSDSAVYQGYELPKTYQKQFYCVSCAVHRRVVRPRNVNVRRNRIPLFVKLRMQRLEQIAQKRAEKKE